MRFSQGCLYRWINPGWTPEELGERLTMAGLELEAIDAAAPAFSHVVVGRVVSVAPHPQADKLRVADVSLGQGEARQIVCGARNVAPGIRVPVALPGALLSNGVKIETSPVRGVLSAGMLCSAQELGLEDKSEGLLILDGDAPLGQDLRVYLGLDDFVLTLGITPNRGDCLSIRGLAQELAALTGERATPPAMPAVVPVHPGRIRVRLDAPDACPRYCGQAVHGIDPHARTPDWLRERLRRAGMRAIHPVVDVMNYVMLEWGQPLHAFDADRLKGDLQVRFARAGESAALLDGSTVELADDILVIADEARVQAVAGVMGAQASAVGADTRDVFVESAFFAPSALAGRARRLGRHSDAAYRFERGVDPALAPQALAHAVGLLVEICGGQPGTALCVEQPDRMPIRPEIVLRRQRIRRVLGTAIPDTDVRRILSGLGMEVVETPDGWRVVPPSARFDLRIEADLIEEVARIFGYDRLPVSVPAASARAEPMPPESEIGRALRYFLAARDYNEVITYSFVSPAWQARIDPACPTIAVQNPISQEMSVMRTSLWPGLLQTLHYNMNHQQQRVRIFELGRVFRGEEQPTMLGALLAGPLYPPAWGNERGTADFFALKGDLEALLQGWRLPELSFRRVEEPALHPGQAAEFWVGGKRLGRIGALHPALVKALELPVTPVLLEMNLPALSGMAKRLPEYRAVSRFPALRRDLALLVPVAVEAEAVGRIIREADPSLIREVRLFDRYQGEGIPADRQSLAFSLLLQSEERTLDDAAVARVMETVLTRVQVFCPATLR